MIFNENALRKIIKEKVKEEYQNYRGELDKIWGYLNKLRDEIVAVESAFSIKIERTKLENEKSKNTKNNP